MNENWYALCVAIIGNLTVEQAFNKLEGCFSKDNSITKEDVQDMSKMKQNMTYREIGEIYCISDGAVHHRLKRFKEVKC